jgi:Trypsin-co-occurring domain 1
MAHELSAHQRERKVENSTKRRNGMKRLVEFPLEEGGSIVVEIDEPETGGTVRAGREDTIEKARETFEDALNKVLPVTKTVVEKLRSMTSKPDEIEVTFGVNLSTMAGAVIASASAEANFSVTVRWTGTHNETTP